MREILIILNDPPYGTERSYNGLRLAHALPKTEPRLEMHLRAQGWYQWVEDGSADGDLHDFQLQRVYPSVAARRIDHQGPGHVGSGTGDRDPVTLQIAAGL